MTNKVLKHLKIIIIKENNVTLGGARGWTTLKRTEEEEQLKVEGGTKTNKDDNMISSLIKSTRHHPKVRREDEFVRGSDEGVSEHFSGPVRPREPARPSLFPVPLPQR